jgi:hypothetical protein
MTNPISIAECCDCMDFMKRYPDKFFEKEKYLRKKFKQGK